MKRNTWARHYQTVWGERSGDPRLPAWLRVAALAYGLHAANGHASFKRGQISLVLSVIEPETGIVRPMDKGNLQRAIRTAVEYGWISEESSARCLVVPGHAITGGMGNEDAPCAQHEHRPRAPRKPGPPDLKVVTQ